MNIGPDDPMGTTDVNKPGAIIAACTLFAASAFLFIITPVFFGSAVANLGVDMKRLGLLATVPLGGTTLTSFLAFFWIHRVNWRYLTGAGAVVSLISYLLCFVYPAYVPILVFLTIGAACNGIFSSIALTALGSTKKPDRCIGFSVFFQIGLGALGLFLLPVLDQRWGISSFFAAFAGVSLFPLIAVFWLPSQGPKAQVTSAEKDGEYKTGGSHFPILLGIGAVLLFYISYNVLWAFFERIGDAAGIGATTIGAVLSGSLLTSGIGALLSTWLADRYGRARPVAIGLLATLVSVVLLSSNPDLFAFAISVTIYSVGTTFALPYIMAIVSSRDETGRFTAWIITAANVGAALGPAIIGYISSGQQFFELYVLYTLCIILSLAGFLWLSSRKGQPVSPLAFDNSQSS